MLHTKTIIFRCSPGGRAVLLNAPSNHLVNTPVMHLFNAQLSRFYRKEGHTSLMHPSHISLANNRHDSLEKQGQPLWRSLNASLERTNATSLQKSRTLQNSWVNLDCYNFALAGQYTKVSKKGWRLSKRVLFVSIPPPTLYMNIYGQRWPLVAR